MELSVYILATLPGMHGCIAAAQYTQALSQKELTAASTSCVLSATHYDVVDHRSARIKQSTTPLKGM